MPEGLTDLEAALRQLQPAPVAQGAMLIEMGRAAAVRSVRRWRWASLVTSTMAVALAGILLTLPEPMTQVRFVYLTDVKPADETRESATESVEPMDAPRSGWPIRRLETRQKLEPVSSEANDETSVESAPLRAGDLIRDPALLSSITKLGDR